MNVGQNINRSFNVISDVVARNGTTMKLMYSQTKQNEIKKGGRIFDSSEQTRAKAVIANSKNRFNISS